VLEAQAAPTSIVDGCFVSSPLSPITCSIFRRERKMEAAGIEPASREVSVGASTCVVGSFTLFACQPPTDGVPSRPARNSF
jgi:hypothetical protein